MTPTQTPKPTDNAHCAELLEIARDMAAAWVTVGGVTGIALIGSVAEGRADAFSDMDILILHAADPPPGTPEAFQGALGPGVEPMFREWRDGQAYHQFYWRGRFCQAKHYGRARFGQRLSEVAVGCNPASMWQITLGALARCRILSDGGGDFGRWKEAAGVYPDGLRWPMVHLHLYELVPRVSLFKGAAREGEWLNACRAREVQASRLLGILCGLNRAWFHTGCVKRADDLIPMMKLAPRFLPAQWKELSTAKAVRACYILDDLLCETFGVVASEFPERNVDWYFRQYSAPASIPQGRAGAT